MNITDNHQTLNEQLMVTVCGTASLDLQAADCGQSIQAIIQSINHSIDQSINQSINQWLVIAMLTQRQGGLAMQRQQNVLTSYQKQTGAELVTAMLLYIDSASVLLLSSLILVESHTMWPLDVSSRLSYDCITQFCALFKGSGLFIVNRILLKWQGSLCSCR